MGMLIIAYAVVWLATLGYVVRLDLRQRRLLKKLEAVEAQLASLPACPHSTSKAA